MASIILGESRGMSRNRLRGVLDEPCVPILVNVLQVYKKTKQRAWISVG